MATVILKCSTWSDGEIRVTYTTSIDKLTITEIEGRKYVEGNRSWKQACNTISVSVGDTSKEVSLGKYVDFNDGPTWVTWDAKNTAWSGLLAGNLTISITISASGTSFHNKKFAGTVSMPPAYTINYDNNGGTSTPATQYKDKGKSITLASKISRNNRVTSITITLADNDGIVSGRTISSNVTTKYSFKEWVCDDEASTKYPAGGTYSADADATMKASWTSSRSGEAKSLPAPTRTGYIFSGWNTKSDGTGTTYSGSITATSSITLYAKWTVATYTITCSKQDGQANPTILYQVYGSKFYTDTSKKTSITKISVPTKSGYTFGGYYTEKDGKGTRITDENGNIEVENTFFESNFTIYAKWTIITYTISYNPNGGSPTPTTQTKEYGKPITISATIIKSPTRTSVTTTFNAQGGSVSPASTTSTVTTSYTFGGWICNDKNNTVYSLGSTYSLNANAEMTAKWGETVTKESVTLPIPTKTGYIFKGWYSSNGTKYTSYSPSTSTTLYARWEAAEYTVLFDLNGGTAASGSLGSVKVEYNTKYSYFPTVSKKGYTFKEWKYNGKTITEETTMQTAQVHTLTAQWGANSYTVTLVNGENVISYVIKYDQGSLYNEEYTPKMKGYNFLGWTTNEDGTDDGYKWSDKLTSKWEWINGENGIEDSHITLYPMWELAEVAIVYNIMNTTYENSNRISKIDDIKSVEEVSTGVVEDYLTVYGWYTKNEEIVSDWGKILDNLEETSNGPMCSIYAKVEPRFKILYIDTKGAVLKLKPTLSRGRSEKTIYPYIEIQNE